MLSLLPGVGFNLSYSGQIIMQQRIHGRSGVSLPAIARFRGECVPQRAGCEQRHRYECQPSQSRLFQKEKCADNDHLKDRDAPLLDSVDQHAFDRSDVLQDSRHDIARRSTIKPGEGQSLNVIVKIAAEVENDLLFESVVKQDPKSIRQVLYQECNYRAGG
jgi:hypothetical protein